VVGAVFGLVLLAVLSEDRRSGMSVRRSAESRWAWSWRL